MLTFLPFNKFLYTPISRKIGKLVLIPAIQTTKKTTVSTANVNWEISNHKKV